MAFWGKELGVKKPQPYVPPPESARLHLSQATLDPNAPEGKKVALKCKVGEEEYFVCSLREGAQESVTLDLYFNSYTEFSLHGAPGAKVHLAGYIVEEEDVEEDEEDEALEVPHSLEGLEGLDEMDEEETDELLRFLQKRRQLNLEGSESEEEEDEEEEEEEEDDDDMEEAPPVGRKKSSVIIEDITDLKPDAPTGNAIPILSGDNEKAAKLDAGKADDKKAGKDALKGQPSEAKAVQGQAKAPAKAKASGKAAAKKEEEEEIDLGDEDTEDGEFDDEEEDTESDEEEEDEHEEGEEEPPAETSNKRKAAAASAEAKLAAKKSKAEDGKPEQQANAQRKKLDAAANDGSPVAATKGKKAQIKTYPNGFVIETVAQGNAAGKLAKPGKKVVVKYVGKLVKTGKVFDQTKGNKTFTFRLGVGEVIKGWDQGVAGMRVGDKRRLTVPPQMGYGSAGVKGVIPGNTALQFDVELCDVKG